MNSTKIVIILLISTILTSCNHKNTTNDSYDIIKIKPYESKNNLHNTNITALSYYFKQDKKERMYKEEDFRQYIKTKNNKVFHVKKIRNDLTNFPSHIFLSSYFFSCAHEVWYDDYLVDVIIPHYYFSNNDTDKIKVDGIGEITAYDNPIIVLMKLK